MNLSNNEKRRYARQIILPEIGEAGQEKLIRAKVLVIGAGGLGSPCLLYLAAAGIGNIGIADGDKVDLANLNRQIIHETGDVGRAKVESAADAIADLNPAIKVTSYGLRVTRENAAEIIKQYDIVIDGSDNFETRFLIHDTCYRLRKPYVMGAVLGFMGQISVFKGYESNKPCYRCFCNEIPPAGTIPNCSENGILGTVTGIIGAWQANEAIKELLGIGESMAGSFIVFDALNSKIKNLRLYKDTKCNFCGS